MHSSGPQGERADEVYRNGNIWGTMHRAVRLIYYIREGTLGGASSWEMFCRKQSPGFGILSREAPEQRFLIYWLYYHLNRHLGEAVLEIQGTAPHFAPGNGEDRVFKSGELPGPLTPALATLSKDGKSIYVVVANASMEKAFPCRIGLKNFAVKSAGGLVLTQKDPEGHPLLDGNEEAMRELHVDVRGESAMLTLPPRSITFVTLRSDGQ